MLNFVVLLLIIGSALEQSLCQDDQRANEKAEQISGVSGGAQSRTIYNNAKSLSPHRMMHFGKRPAHEPPPTISTAQVLDLYDDGPKNAPAQNRFEPMMVMRQAMDETPIVDSYPYVLFFNLPRERSLEAVPDHQSAPKRLRLKPDSAGGQSARGAQVAGRPLVQADLEEQVLANSREQPFKKLMRLMSAENGDVDSYELGANGSGVGTGTNNEEQAANSATDQQEGDPQVLQPQIQRPQGQINLVGRSLPMGRDEAMNLSKAHISSLLFGQRFKEAPSSLISFIKKAEPQKMTFMHFG